MLYFSQVHVYIYIYAPMTIIVLAWLICALERIFVSCTPDMHSVRIVNTARSTLSSVADSPTSTLILPGQPHTLPLHYGMHTGTTIRSQAAVLCCLIIIHHLCTEHAVIKNYIYEQLHCEQKGHKYQLCWIWCDALGAPVGLDGSTTSFKNCTRKQTKHLHK